MSNKKKNGKNLVDKNIQPKKELSKSSGLFSWLFKKKEKLSRQESRSKEREEAKITGKKGKLLRNLDFFAKAAAYLKCLFKPEPKPELTPAKYEKAVYNQPLWAVTLALSAALALAGNFFFLLWKKTPEAAFPFELFLLMALFTVLFFILIKLIFSFFPPFSFGREMLVGYLYGGEFFDLKSEDEEPFNFSLRFGDLVFKKYKNFPRRYEFPKIVCEPVKGEGYKVILERPEVEFLVPASDIYSREDRFSDFLGGVEETIRGQMAKAFLAVYKVEDGAISAFDPGDRLNFLSFKNKLDQFLSGVEEKIFDFAGYVGEPKLEAGSFCGKVPLAERLAEAEAASI